MPTRIYALAKDLKIDSKDLVDLCAKAGIPGKGSALASLEDDEVTKLKTYLDGAAGKKAAAVTAASATHVVNTRDVLSMPVAGTATLPPPPPTRAAPKPAKPAPVETETTIAQPAAEVVPPSEPTGAPPSVAAEVVTEVIPAPAKPAKTSAAKVEKTPPEDGAAPKVAKGPGSRKVAAKDAGGKETPPPADVAAVAPPVAPPAKITPPPARPTSTRIGSTTVPKRDMGNEPSMAPVRGDSLIHRPSGIKVISTANKPAPLGSANRKKEADAATKPGERRAPVIRVADMPEVRQPTKAPLSKEPAAQKPVISLKGEAIKGPLKKLTDRLEAERQTKIDSDRKGVKPGAALLDPARAGRGGKKGKPGEEGERDTSLAGMADVRADRKRKAKVKGVMDREDEGVSRRRRNLTRIKAHGSTAAPRKEKAALSLPCTVRTFCESTGVGAGTVIKALMGMGVMANINAPIQDELVEVLASELGLELNFKAEVSLEDQLQSQFDGSGDDEALLIPRAPIVTFLGHVDHGKTSLLDRIIGTNVVAGEAGGITQHIRAYSINTKDGRRVAFVDTPGHEAFTEMRARGANVTDIAVLVVAADDGMMPQTEEALSHAKAANVPIVVAMNKIDLPGADEQKVLQQLATAGLLPSEWGGDVEVVRTSAITGVGMDTLLETLLVTAELHEYKSNPDRAASGMCLEAEQEPGRGVIAKIMVQNGTLKDGDVIVCGAAHGRVKAMYDTLRPRVKVKLAGPSTPVNITGLDVAPQAGDKFYVLDDLSHARDLAAQRATQTRQSSLSGTTTKVSFEDFQSRLTEGRLGQVAEVSVLNLIVRADVRGSIEAILKELSKFDHPEVKIKVLQASVGGVSVADVTLAHASGAVIIGFNVIPDEAARALAEDRGVQIRRYEIIYKVSDDIKAMLEGRLKPEERIIEMGRALVKQVFAISRVGAIAGSQIIQGTIERGCRIRINRENRTIGDYALDSLRREKDDVKEVARGMECGIKLTNFSDIKEGDILEAYKIEEVARTL